MVTVLTGPRRRQATSFRGSSWGGATFLGPFSHTFLHPVTRDGAVGVRAEIPVDDQPNKRALPGDQWARITPGTEGSIYQEQDLALLLPAHFPANEAGSNQQGLILCGCRGGAQGDHPITLLDFVTVPHLDIRQWLGSLDLDDRKVQ